MEYCDPDWPPGTIKLQQLLDLDTKDTEIILQPRPTDDPNDPLCWPKWQKVINYTLASFYAMMVYAFVNATSPTWGPMGTELHFSTATLTNTYAVGCATLAVGAPMLIPFALKYGSRPVYVFSSLAQFLISIWAAKTQTAGDWWGVNALQCWLGALCEVLIQMTIADVFFVHQRGLMNAIYIWVSRSRLKSSCFLVSDTDGL
jgi:MFS family permease